MPSLEEVYGEIQEDPWWQSLRLPGIRFVPGFGCRRPKALIAGEAPGAVENNRQRPFRGPSGAVLDHLMGLAGLALEETGCVCGATARGGGHSLTCHATIPNAFVTNVVKYRPPNNATPSIADIFHAKEGFKQQKMGPGFASVIDTSLPEGAGSLRREWAALGRPRVVVSVGGVAHAAFHPMGFEGISRWVGQPIPRRSGEVDVWFISQFHPAYGLRKGPRVQDQMSKDWTKMGEFLSKEGLL